MFQENIQYSTQNGTQIEFRWVKVAKFDFQNWKMAKIQSNLEWSEMLLGRWETVQNTFKMLKLSISEHIKPKK